MSNRTIAILVAFSVFGIAPAAPAQEKHGYIFNFTAAEDFRGTRIYRQADNLAYAYETSHAAVDSDGAPNAYHPADIGKNCMRDEHIGLDCPENAGYPHTSWWNQVLVPDPSDRSKAFVQTEGAFKGFFVAMTSLRNPKGDDRDPATYVDARSVPYVVIPDGFGRLPHVAAQGDVGVATDVRTGKSTTFIVADSGGGPDSLLGEASIALYAALGFPDANPRTGKGLPEGPIQYIIFPGSHRKGAAIWPRTNDDIREQTRALIASTPGIQR